MANDAGCGNAAGANAGNGSSAAVGEEVMTAATDRWEGPDGVRMGNSTGDCDGLAAPGVEGLFASLIAAEDEAMMIICGVIT